LHWNKRHLPAVFIALTFFAWFALRCSAHEFWISLKSGQIGPGDDIVGDLMVGIMMRGNPYPYLPEYIVRFDVTAQRHTDPVGGMPGDLPALNYKTRAAGLQVIVHQTVPFRLTYGDWELFQRYVREEGFPEVEALHLERALPMTGFSERYTRYVKALVQAGPTLPDDADIRTGLPFEIVAEANPYEPGLAALPVRLYWRDQPAPNVQISILHDIGTVERQTVRTDASGRASIKLASGSYLLSAVRIDPVENDTVAWHSHWAALSFFTAK